MKIYVQKKGNHCAMISLINIQQNFKRVHILNRLDGIAKNGRKVFFKVKNLLLRGA